ncbi:MAG: histidine kinase, partial [Bacteroidaceae bacterium]|nr:histidine kinase [Bacteroidaceae bacterium]
MKYENRLKLQENIIYGVVWALVFTIPILALYLTWNKEESASTFDWSQVFSIWKEIVPFFILFLLHNYLLAPILIRCQKKSLYFTLAFCLLVLFATGQAVFTKRPDPMGPPPGMENNERPPLPPNGDEGPLRPDGRPDDGGPGARGFERENPPRRQDLTRMLMENPAITNTFIAFLLISMNLGIKEYFRSVRNQRDTEELRRQHLEQELEYLRYQINPHFFMNTLNNIHALVDIDPEQAKGTIL